MLRITILSRLLGLAIFFLLATASHASDELTIVVFGDSLSSGYHMDINKSWPALLERRLQDSGWQVRILNASRKGETSEGGRKRLPEILNNYRPALVILALGANDGLRGKSLITLRNNLRDMVTMVMKSGAMPILVGMRLPPNYDSKFAEDFYAVFAQTAQQTGTPFVPFLLKDVVEHPELFLADHLHPNTEAQPKLLDVVWPVLDSTLASHCDAQRIATVCQFSGFSP